MKGEERIAFWIKDRSYFYQCIKLCVIEGLISIGVNVVLYACSICDALHGRHARRLSPEINKKTQERMLRDNVALSEERVRVAQNKFDAACHNRENLQTREVYRWNSLVNNFFNFGVEVLDEVSIAENELANANSILTNAKRELILFIEKNSICVMKKMTHAQKKELVKKKWLENQPNGLGSVGFDDKVDKIKEIKCGICLESMLASESISKVEPLKYNFDNSRSFFAGPHQGKEVIFENIICHQCIERIKKDRNKCPFCRGKISLKEYNLLQFFYFLIECV